MQANRPRRRVRSSVIAILVVFGFLVLAYCSSTLDIWRAGVSQPDLQAVNVSRYVLGRWPKNWSEVESACHQYFGDPYLPGRNFEDIRLLSAPGDKCTVVIRFRNVFGMSYEKSATLTWSSDKEAHYQGREVHTFFARMIADSFRELRERKPRLGLTHRDLLAGLSRLESEEPPKSAFAIGPHITGVAIEGSGNTADLVVRFADGVVRRIPVRSDLKAVESSSRL